MNGSISLRAEGNEESLLFNNDCTKAAACTQIEMTTQEISGFSERNRLLNLPEIYPAAVFGILRYEHTDILSTLNRVNSEKS